MVLTVKAISLLALFGRQPYNTTRALGSGAVMLRAVRAAEDPHAVGPALLHVKVQQRQLFLSFPEPRSCSCVTGFISHLPPTFLSLPLKSPCPEQCWVSVPCVEQCFILYCYTQIHKRKTSLNYILLRISVEMLWIFPAEEGIGSEQQYFQGYPNEEGGAVVRAVFKQPHVCWANLSALSL